MINNSKQNSIKDEIRNVSDTQLNRNMFTDLYIVTKVNTYENKTEEIKELTCDVQQMDNFQRFTNVQWISQGLGNGKGFIMPPKIGDVVLIIFYGQTNAPLIIGNVFNIFMKYSGFKQDSENVGVNDNILDVKEDEWIMINKLNGAYIYCNSDGEILIKNTTTDAYTVNITSYTESFMKFEKDGNISVQCKGGIGNLTL